MAFLRCLAAGILFITASSSGKAVIIYGSNTASAPSLMDYVGTVGGASGVYLGNYNGAYWVITANHVGAGDFTVGSTTYSYVEGSGVRIGSLDIYVFQVEVPENSILASQINLTLSSSTPATGSSVLMIGNGGDERESSITRWLVSGSGESTTWTEVTSGPSNASGYKYDSSGREASWGTNTIASVTVSNGVSYLVTTFDSVNGDAQAVVGDSGGGVFSYNSSTGSYELSGIMVAVGTYTNQPEGTVVVGTLTYSIDIASYRDLILAAIPEPSTVFLVSFGSLALTMRANRRLRYFISNSQG